MDQIIYAIKNDQIEWIFTNNKILNYKKDQMDDTAAWKFRKITAHKVPLQKNHPNYKDSTYNVITEWENGRLCLSRSLQ